MSKRKIKSENQLSLFNFSEEQDNAVICKRESIGFGSLFKERKSLETKEDWQEWQANYFSSALLIPKCTLKIALKPYLDTYDVMDQASLLNKLEVEEIMELVGFFEENPSFIAQYKDFYDDIKTKVREDW